MGAVTPFLAIAGTVLSAVGQVSSGIAARNQAEFQAKIARNNAILAERKAAEALSLVNRLPLTLLEKQLDVLVFYVLKLLAEELELM